MVGRQKGYPARKKPTHGHPKKVGLLETGPAWTAAPQKACYNNRSSATAVIADHSRKFFNVPPPDEVHRFPSPWADQGPSKKPSSVSVLAPKTNWIRLGV